MLFSTFVDGFPSGMAFNEGRCAVCSKIECRHHFLAHSHNSHAFECQNLLIAGPEIGYFRTRNAGQRALVYFSMITSIAPWIMVPSKEELPEVMD